MMSEEVKKKYSDVQMVLDEAMQKADSVDILGEKENVELSQIKKTLESLNTEFKKEIEKLENASEWDKFCIAFFGETNAGKSTIIETLRIIYNEETRRTEAIAQKNAYHSLMVKHCKDYSGLITSLEDLNISLQNRRRNYNWLAYVATSLAGVVIGLLLAHWGIFIW